MAKAQKRMHRIDDPRRTAIREAAKRTLEVVFQDQLRQQNSIELHSKRILQTERIRGITAETSDAVSQVLQTVFEDQSLQQEYPKAIIRYTAACGEIARKILATLGVQKTIGQMAIGDIAAPEDVFETQLDLIAIGMLINLGLTMAQGDVGYDIPAQGDPTARAKMIDLFDRHYGFSRIPRLTAALKTNSTITAGGMRGLDDILTAAVEYAKTNGMKLRSIFPDNSFGTWHRINEIRSHGGTTATNHVIPTTQKNLLHASPSDVDSFYEKNPLEENTQDLWCLTPVGNPSGTRMKGSDLTATCERIIYHNPEAIIVLDCTYLRTLKPEIAQELIAGVISDPKILNRIVWLDSFSKTHGMAGLRIGTFFSANAELYKVIQSINMTLGAGNGLDKNGYTLALAGATKKQQKKFSDLHEFWARERAGLYKYLIGNGNFSHLFDDDQSHITEDQLTSPQGLYLLLKIKEGVDFKKVAVETGCLGVQTPMRSGQYIRFAVGKIKEPTYAKYLEDEPENPSTLSKPLNRLSSWISTLTTPLRRLFTRKS